MSSCCLLLGETSLLLRAWQKYLFIHSDWWLPGSHQVLTLVTGTWLTSLGLLPFLRSIVCFTSKKKNKVQGYCSPHPPPHTHTHKGHEVAPSLAHPSPDLLSPPQTQHQLLLLLWTSKLDDMKSWIIKIKMPSDTKEVKEILLRASGSKGSQRNHVFICNQSFIHLQCYSSCLGVQWTNLILKQ